MTEISPHPKPAPLRRMVGLLLMFALAAAWAPALGATKPGDDPALEDAHSTTGPVPPAGILLEGIAETAAIDNPVLIPGVPAYLWYNGCGPTAAGMMIGYWDGHGFDDLVPGSAATQTEAVNAMISSAENYADYCLPLDYYPTMLPDKSELPLGDEHVDNSVADFMKTSQSAANNFYGWSYLNAVDDALTGYVSLVAPGYISMAVNQGWPAFSWAGYKAEIDAGRPVMLLVDTGGNGETDHFVTGVGYGVQDGLNMYACYDTWDHEVHWYRFAAMAVGQPYGIYAATKFIVSTEPLVDSYEPDSPCSAAKTIESGVRQAHSLYPAGDDDWVTFTLEQVSDITLRTSGMAGDPLLWLYASDCSTLLASDDDSGVDLFSQITRSALPAGTYYALVREYGDNDPIYPYYLDFIAAAAEPAPTLDLLQPAIDVAVLPGGEVLIAWEDSDPDDNATIALAYDSDKDPANGGYAYLVSGLPEDPDEAADQYTWNTADVLPGTYYVWGVITDPLNPPAYAAAAGRVIVQPPGDAFEPDGLYTQAAPLEAGLPQIHSIDPAADVDWAAFILSRTLALTLETSGATDSDTRLWLYDSALLELGFDDDGGAGLYSRLERTCGVDALPPGLYYVKVDEYNNNNLIPEYTLSFSITQECLPFQVFIPQVLR